MIQIRLLAFGVARDIIGSGSLKLELTNEMTAQALKDLLGKRYEKLNKLKSFMIAVNDEYADPEQMIRAEDEIAIIPPVSGG